MLRRTWVTAGAGLAARAWGAAWNQESLDKAADRIRETVASGDVQAAALQVTRGGHRFVRTFGLAKSPDSVFLLASITKPMTAAGVLLLVDRGAISLADPVRKYIPEFAGGERDLVTIRHLLTHTSGLPDQLAENIGLRKRHAPLKEFVAGACRTPLLFRPGSKVSYQSMGILLAAEVAERVTRRPFRDLLRDELFRPLGMKQTSLGLGGRRIPDTMPAQVQSAPALYGTAENDWNWNSQYWRDLGAPWGGAHSTVGDVTTLLRAFLKPDGRVLRVATARAMVTNQTPDLNEAWGLGWMLKPGGFGKACSPKTFGHWGATGTVGWADPATDTVCVLLTTKPADRSRDGLLGPVSDLVAEAVAG